MIVFCYFIIGVPHIQAVGLPAMYIIIIAFEQLLIHRDTAKAAEAPRPGRFHRT